MSSSRDISCYDISFSLSYAVTMLLQRYFIIVIRGNTLSFRGTIVKEFICYRGGRGFGSDTFALFIRLYIICSVDQLKSELRIEWNL